MPNIPAIQIVPDFEERYPEASAHATECAMNLVLTADMLEKRIANLLVPFDLSPASGLVLSILADSPTPLSPIHIADRLIISRASVTSLLDSLEKRGYVKRQPHRVDRRMLLIELTKTGHQVADRFRLIVHRQQKLWLDAVSDQEQEQLIQIMHRLQATLVEGQE